LTYLLWAITGAGAYLRDVAGVVKKVKSETGVKVTIAFSEWGYAVARLYGLNPVLEQIASGGYMEEWLVENEGFYYVGRVNRGRYKLVLIAPATSSSVAKMVCGIADTLPTLIFAEACKSSVPVVILPSDIPNEEGVLVSETPCYVDRELCRYGASGYEYCKAAAVCPVNAITVYYGKPRVDYSKCVGCGLCAEACPYGAVKCWERIVLKPRQLDLENIEKLSRFSNVYVVQSVSELYTTVKKLLEG